MLLFWFDLSGFRMVYGGGNNGLVSSAVEVRSARDSLGEVLGIVASVSMRFDWMFGQIGVDRKTMVWRRGWRLAWCAALCVVMTGSFLLAVRQPTEGRAHVVAELVGYTNVSGERLAVFGVTNLSSRIIFAYLPTVQVKSASAAVGFTNFFQGGTNQWRRLHQEIGRGEAVQFTILAPTLSTGSAWRVTMNVYADFDPVGRLRRFLLGRRKHPFQVQSEWIEIDGTGIEN